MTENTEPARRPTKIVDGIEYIQVSAWIPVEADNILKQFIKRDGRNQSKTLTHLIMSERIRRVRLNKQRKARAERARKGMTR